jgi:hypothetical protein
MPGQPVNPVVMTTQQCLEGLAVAGDGGSDKVSIRIVAGVVQCFNSIDGSGMI